MIFFCGIALLFLLFLLFLSLFVVVFDFGHVVEELVGL